MKLGEKLGEGAGSEAYAWADGQIVKLFKTGIDGRAFNHEVGVTRAVFDAGAPAPEVLDVVEVNGRPGIVFPRYDGSTLRKMVAKGALSPGSAGEIMARLHYSLHAGAYRTSLISFRRWAQIYLGELTKRRVAEDVIATVQRVLASLPESGVLCHGDLHADNILMTENGPMMIDWVSALNANPLMDIARQHLTFTLIADVALPTDARLKQQRREADSAFLGTYAALTHWTEDALLNAINPYMIVMAAMRMMESGSTAKEQAYLSDFIRSAPP